MYDLENPTVYNLIIIGTGPAGLTASIYTSCFRLKHLVIGKVPGGQMALAPDILNYPGFENISGKELTERMVAQVKKLGGEIVVGSVIRISKLTGPAVRPPAGGSFASPVNTQLNSFELETQEEKKYQAKTIILATGTERRKLNVPGEVEYTGRGVHYCATFEKLDHAGKACGVIGGANAAVQAAVQLAQVAAKVYIIYRGENLRGDSIWLEQVERNPKIEVIYNTAVTEILGDGRKVTGVVINSKFKIQNSKLQLKIKNDQNDKQQLSNNSGHTYLLPLDKLFIEIGGVPGSALVIPLGVEMTEEGYIQVDEKMATNIEGIFAAGDLASHDVSIRQISSAVGLGARAAASVFAFLKKEKAPSLWGVSRIRREVT